MKVNSTFDTDKPSCVIVGTGSIGQRHLSLLNAAGKINVFAFPVRIRTHVDMLEKGIQILENWKQVTDLGISSAIIATDTGRHPLDIQYAIDAGCHVLVEKPMAVNAVSAFLKVQEARRLNQNMWVGCCMRFHQALNIFREKLPEIGKVFSARIECQSYLPDWRPQRPYKDSYSARYDEGGVLRDLIHEVDYAGWLYGWPDSVTAKVRTTGLLEISSEDTADIFWETQSGAVVSITLDYLSRPARRQMRAFGEFGTLEWDGINGCVILNRSEMHSEKFDSSQTRDEMYLAQDLAFLDSTSVGGAFDERLASGVDGVRALAICDASRESSKNQCEIHVSYPEGL